MLKDDSCANKVSRSYNFVNTKIIRNLNEDNCFLVENEISIFLIKIPVLNHLDFKKIRKLFLQNNFILGVSLGIITSFLIL